MADDVRWRLGPLVRVGGFITDGWWLGPIRLNDMGLVFGAVFGVPLLIGSGFAYVAYADDAARRDRLLSIECMLVDPETVYWSDDDGDSGYDLRWTLQWTHGGGTYTDDGPRSGDYSTQAEADAALALAKPQPTPCLVDPEDPAWATRETSPPSWLLWLALGLGGGGLALWGGIALGEGPTSVTVTS